MTVPSNISLSANGSQYTVPAAIFYNHKIQVEISIQNNYSPHSSIENYTLLQYIKYL
jgi:hypothetical protein